MKYPRHLKYKDSGIEWLGEVPEGWEIKRLKWVCDAFPSNVDKKSYDDGQPVSLCNYTDVYYNESITPALNFMAATATTEQVIKFSLKSGDTIITKDSETADDIAIAAYVPEDMPGVVCGYHLSIVRPKGKVCGAFIKNIFDSSYAKNKFAVLANGLTRVGLGQYALDNVEFPFPPLEEQQAIAAFLDTETARMDALIAEYETLIDLLKEKRQALISQAVTKGLHPDAPMKDSGVEWLGEVPEGWEVKPMKRYGTIRYGIGEPPQYQSIGVPLIRATNIHAGKLYSEGLVYVDPKDIPGARIVWLQPGDIIVVRSGAYTGDSAIIPPELGESIAGFDMVLRCNDVSAMFVQYSLLSNYLKSAQIDLEKMRAAQPHLNSEELGNCVLLTPPLEEQCAIAAFLDAETARIDVLIKEAENGIRLLRERRTTLISDAVTGKIDVRCVAKTGAPVFVTNNKGGTQ